MILQALVQHYENLAGQDKVSKPGWCHAKVSYLIDLKEDGTIKEIIPLKREEERGKKKVWVSETICVPEMVTRSSGVSANFLCDNAKYFLGIDADGTGQRVIECFQAAKARHLSILKDSESMMAKAICRYFEHWNPETAQENPVVKEHWEELNDGGNLIFGMGGHYAQDDEQIKRIWEKQQEQKEEGQVGTCLVTGQKTKIARIHRGIKGVPGAQSSGAALVSFNAPAFESYGKEQSYNAPVGQYAEFAYTTALNYLLNQREYRFPMWDSMVVFWAESGEQEYQRIFFSSLDPQPDNQEQIRKVFENLKRGIWVDLEDINLDMNQKFYILCLAPNAARLSVRFFYQNSFGNILKNIENHYSRMEIVRPSWENRAYLGIRPMLMETVNQKSKDKSPVPNMAAMVLKAVLSDDRYPASLYTDTLIRIRAEQGKVTCGRAAIIKAFLIQNYKWKEGEYYMGLNEECKDPAYVLGRLFAVLEFVQKDAADQNINTTIRDRYFNSACTAPALIFPTLLKLKNSHIKKLERNSLRKKFEYECLVTTLMEKLDMTEETEGFPRRLSLEEQGKFMLGYYHQIQKKYEKKEDK
ncbi:type I-C CRISPR-associated protein Cas8c/Csd1 [Roseburia sp. BX0805]|uniref:Type I-C CRISPR-associated protein Cas8c/Csd1 n=1 Tax=Roseburia yibonii TaxID=2763063 RepID=A0ABR7I960_9FIRM|nr:type I-C CRISPR-associated protein Cas8c/Csd1 [Roseburia yibonii]MBC5753464.1 type I-C CRISPR-associated protein Cas8c/Csd1 [Roseburia yibonii]